MFSGVRAPVGPAEVPQPSGDTTIVGMGLLPFMPIDQTNEAYKYGVDYLMYALTH